MLILEQECGANLPFCEKPEALQLIERIRFAALRVSVGSIAKLTEAVQLAKSDWRDLLVAAGFGDSMEEHHKWCKETLLRGYTH